MPRLRIRLNRLGSCALAGLLAIVSGYGYQQPEDEKESYIIYETVLRIKEPRIATWAIVRQTRDFKLCLRPADPNQESLYRDVFDDYREKNKSKLALERKFNLPDYTLVEPEARGRSSPARSFAVFSAVGFNASRTHAAVCFWAGTSGTCYVLVKKDDTWQLDRDWHSGCAWAA
jgi:hypothetical protein